MGFMGIMGSKMMANMGKGGKKGGGPPLPDWHHESLQSYQDGTDYVPQTGPANLHEGEAVIPKDQNAMRLALMQQMQKLGGQNPAGLQPRQQMPQLGGNNATVGSGTAVPRVGGIQPSATPPSLPGRNTESTLRGLPGMVMQVKQQKHMDQMNKARALAGQYIAMMNSGDPKLQKAAQQLLADPKNHKVFDKATTDPMSPEYQGVQAAYRDVMQEDAQKAQYQQMQQQMEMQRAQIEATKQLGYQRQAYGEKAERSGDVTAQDVFKADNAKQRTSMQLDSRSRDNQARITAAGERLAKSITSLEKRTQMQQEGATERAGMKESGANKRQNQRLTAQNQAVTAMVRQYKNIQAQVAALGREQTALDKERTEHPIEAWATGEDQVFEAKQGALDAKRQALEMQLTQLDTTITQMTQGGVLPQETKTTTSTPAGAPASSQGKPVIHDMSQ